MERYQVRTVKALLEDPETLSISTLALSTANRVTRTDCRQGDNVGASPTLACVNSEQVERTDRADTQIGSNERWWASVVYDAVTPTDAIARLSARPVPRRSSGANLPDEDGAAPISI